MTNSITSSTPALPITATQQPVAPATSLVDSALAEVLGTSVTGGGADAPSSDPRAGIPEFVRRFLPAEPGGTVPSAADGISQQQATQQGEPQQDAQRGWAWVSSSFPQQTPPMKGEPVSPAPPTPVPAPPMKGEGPPMKGEPPIKGAPPSKVEQVEDTGDRGRHTVKPGDYLSKIAPKYGVTWQQLYWENRGQIKHPDLIHPGQVLRIPSRDLKVPAFPYTPMIPAAPGKGKGKSEPTAPPKKDTPPAPPKGETRPPAPPKGETRPPAPPKGETPPPAPPKGETPPPAPPKGETRPPGSDPGRGGTLPPAPPAPDGGKLPPPLPS